MQIGDFLIFKGHGYRVLGQCAYSENRIMCTKAGSNKVYGIASIEMRHITSWRRKNVELIKSELMTKELSNGK